MLTLFRKVGGCQWPPRPACKCAGYLLLRSYTLSCTFSPFKVQGSTVQSSKFCPGLSGLVRDIPAYSGIFFSRPPLRAFVHLHQNFPRDRAIRAVRVASSRLTFQAPSQVRRRFRRRSKREIPCKNGTWFRCRRSAGDAWLPQPQSLAKPR